MSYRPQRATGADANHYIPRDYLRDRCSGFEVAPADVRGSTIAYTANYRGWHVCLTDTSKYGGILPDWLIESAKEKAAWMEVKTPEAYSKKGEVGCLTAGEAWMQTNSGIPFFIVKDEADFEQVLNYLIDF